MKKPWDHNEENLALINKRGNMFRRYVETRTLCHKKFGRSRQIFVGLEHFRFPRREALLNGNILLYQQHLSYQAMMAMMLSYTRRKLPGSGCNRLFRLARRREKHE